MKTKLDKSEKEIERTAGLFRPIPKKQIQKIETIIDAAKKTRNINIRLSETVLERLKHRSKEEGLPYQTLIASVLHKYVNHRLVDEEAIRKSIKLLHSEN